MKRNVFLGIAPAPYRVDLCNWLYREMDCEIYHLEQFAEELAFDRSALRDAIRFDYRTYPAIPFSGKGMRRLQEILDRHQPELVFTSEFSAATILLGLLRKRRRAPFRVVSVCDDSVDMIHGNDFSRRHALARRFVPRLVDNLLLDSPEVVRWYRERFGKGVFFPIIADERRLRAGLERALPRARELAVSHGLQGSRVLLYVGRLIPLKQVDLILRAYAPLKEEARLVIVGDGPDLAGLKTLDAGLGTRAVFTGRKSGEDLLAWYNIGDVHLLASRVEAFGAVTGEALQAGLYSLVSERAGSRCLIDAENGRVLPADDPDAWTSALRQTLDKLSPKEDIRLKDSRLRILFEPALREAISAL